MAKRYEQVVRLSADLRGVEPTVRRRFEVPAEMTLADLHEVLQVTFQWDDDHLHSFQAGETRYGPPEVRDGFGPPVQPEEGIKIGTLARKGRQRLRYLYDFGDDWLHDIRILQVRDADPERPAPALLHAQGRTPPEDCGGPFGYAALLAILDDPTHPDHAEYAEWYPDGIDPHAPETEGIEKRLEALRREWRPRGRRSTKAVGA
ncbi:hypothetical protein CKO28_15735 [Rhodovibrio sodomensis]|uniref:Plasmid pRiA4b Orf3-like domain-containing protein n=1 Tax=Rhodovibrio sodomensis TaxID=1088 RepID=A0ABS1DGA8_9PROT|nr:plasmid pRiA4b ORF-3 family protein [Rhodovibrio sodomensis]MBK1669490.1 hypothetical protein [Rhodovibrio sodomensis]